MFAYFIVTYLQFIDTNDNSQTLIQLFFGDHVTIANQGLNFKNILVLPTFEDFNHNFLNNLFQFLPV